jgi:hypothetical protein
MWLLRVVGFGNGDVALKIICWNRVHKLCSFSLLLESKS